MATNINTILNWFKTGLKPTQKQFWATWASFWHKDEQIPQNSISGLENALNTKAEKVQLDTHLNDKKAHADLFDKKANTIHTHIINDIEGLENTLNEKAEKTQLDTHLNDKKAHADLFDKKVDKIDGMDLSQENFTTILKDKLQNLENAEFESKIQIIEIEATELKSLDVAGVKKWLDAKIDLQLNIGTDVYLKIIGIKAFTKEFTKEFN
ncbi:hypothetical protein IUY40_18555 [Flavobacterium sp. ALJ2]|uniref:hypothetical protein n=1 Tax=Flavobacterium sp. ALJ2 TaxID=2786960 RepID=UPI00189F0C51|nr:hypothetical protein [Flavobacterium sp. ALJ2]MBF7093538.1 hypothetical protein [Flavobacterium sp. ALJ2]